jgi:sporulation protein YlmC with PRC-barrel domain
MMRAIWIAGASALALLATPVLAQTNSSPGGRGGNPPAAVQKVSQPDPMKQEDISQIKGASVYGSDDTKIGSVSTVLMEPDSKQIDRLVVGAGGVLGLGAHEVALPLGDFHWDTSKGGFKIAETEADLKSMPAWAANDHAAVGGSSPPPIDAAPARTPSTSR